MRSFATILVTFSLPLCAFASHLGSHPRRHSDVALRAPHGQALQKRDDRFTYYDISVGQVACGGYYSPSDFVVALNAAQFGGSYPSPECFKAITITANGKTTSAKIVDACPGCPYGGLDLTQGLFEFFGPTSLGVLSGSWEFAGSAPAQVSKAPENTPAEVAPQYHPPSPTHQHTTSTPPPPSSSSSSSSTSSSTSTSKTHSSSSSSSSTATSTASQPLSTPAPSSAPTSSEPNYNNGPASDIAQSNGTIVPDSQGGFGALFSLYEVILDFGVISEVCKS